MDRRIVEKEIDSYSGDILLYRLDESEAGARILASKINAILIHARIL
ncbi:MAG: hypothetical protein GSR87_00050 [Desulfurococcales archaeon]|nr:hypothetical protein [Desulfurococcales archaeon]